MALPASPEHPFWLSSPISSPHLSRLSHFVSLYRSINALFFSPLLSFPLSFLDKPSSPQSCLCFVNSLSRLHFFSTLHLSPSPYLPTRLVITSSTEELMAHFRKGRGKKERRNRVLLLLEAESNARRETDSSLAHFAARIQICAMRASAACACTCRRAE